MQKLHYRQKLGLVVVGFALFAVVFYSTPILDGLRLYSFINFTPMDLVFDEGIKLEDYDASVILSCLHGGGCPDGIKYKNDETGEIEEREIVSKTAQPYTPPPDPNAPPDPSLFDTITPVTVTVNAEKADIIAMIIYVIIIIGIASVGIMIYEWKKRK